MLEILDFGSAFKKHVFSDLYNHNITYMQSSTNMKVPQSSTRVSNVKYFSNFLPSLEREMLPVGLSRSNWGNINNKKGVLVAAKLCSLHVVLSILSWSIINEVSFRIRSLGSKCQTNYDLSESGFCWKILILMRQLNNTWAGAVRNIWSNAKFMIKLFIWKLG